MARQRDLSETLVLATIDAAGGIHSGFEAARVLTAIAEGQPLGPAARARYVEVAQRINSAFERDRALARLVSAPSANR